MKPWTKSSNTSVTLTGWTLLTVRGKRNLKVARFFFHNPQCIKFMNHLEIWEDTHSTRLLDVAMWMYKLHSSAIKIRKYTDMLCCFIVGLHINIRKKCLATRAGAFLLPRCSGQVARNEWATAVATEFEMQETFLCNTLKNFFTFVAMANYNKSSYIHCNASLKNTEIYRTRLGLSEKLIFCSHLWTFADGLYLCCFPSMIILQSQI